jgi:hypothetical protein
MSPSNLLNNWSNRHSALLQSASSELALDALAASRGIESHYMDARSAQQEVLPHVRAKLLAAMGVPKPLRSVYSTAGAFLLESRQRDLKIRDRRGLRNVGIEARCNCSYDVDFSPIA